MTEIIKNTQDEEVFIRLSYNTQVEGLSEVDALLEHTGLQITRLSTVRVFNAFSKNTGGYVKLLPEFGFCPVLIGDNGQPLFLYEFVEVLDELLDYDEIRSEMPFLSFSQINGALSFLRKLSQFNALGIDLDEIEDADLLDDSELLDELRTALADKEVSRVLDFDEQNG